MRTQQETNFRQTSSQKKKHGGWDADDCVAVIHCRYIVLFGLSFFRPPNDLVVRSFIVLVVWFSSH